MRYRAKAIDKKSEVVALVREYGVPDMIEASCVSGGWRREPKDKSEVDKLVAEGLKASPIGTVLLCWAI